jgi:hypothetical protein
MSYQVKFHKDTSSELASIMVHKPLLFSFLVENIFKCFESCENEDAVASVINCTVQFHFRSLTLNGANNLCRL